MSSFPVIDIFAIVLSVIAVTGFLFLLRSIANDTYRASEQTKNERNRFILMIEHLSESNVEQEEKESTPDPFA